MAETMTAGEAIAAVVCNLCGARTVQTEHGLQCAEFVGHKDELAKRRLGDDPCDFMGPKKKTTPCDRLIPRDSA